jgi:hypothetical protein
LPKPIKANLGHAECGEFRSGLFDPLTVRNIDQPHSQWD